MTLAASDDRCFAVYSFDPDGPNGLPAELFAWEGLERYTILRRSGAAWVPTGLTLATTRGPIYDTSAPATVWDRDGSGPLQPAMYVGDPSGLRVWTGSGWQAVPDSAGGGSLLAVVSQSDPAPYSGSLFSVRADKHIVRWDNGAWVSIGVGEGSVGTGLDGSPYAIAGFDIDGPGPRAASLFVGGELITVSQVPARGLARYGCEEDWDRCVGDVNHDFTVNFDDISDVLTNWGAVGSLGFPAFGDANDGYSVGFTDLAAVLTSWGGDCSGARLAVVGAAPVIEPDAGSPMGQLISVQREEGYAGMTRLLANWPPSSR